MYNPQLETFIRVAEMGSFNKAAESLFVTAPAVIKQINLLENKLGFALFKRSRRGLELTEVGKLMYQEAQYIIGYCKDVLERAEKIIETQQNILRIGASPMTPVQFLLDLWPRIGASCQDIRFELIPYENTPKNAQEILAHLGQKIDVVAGIFDEGMLSMRQCAGMELACEPVRCALPLHHPLAQQDSLRIEDLYGQKLMIIHRGWNNSIDRLRDELAANHPQIELIDFDFFCTQTFNSCVHSDSLIISIDYWKGIHPMLRTTPVDWDCEVSFGILHAPKPSATVARFLNVIQEAMDSQQI